MGNDLEHGLPYAALWVGPEGRSEGVRLLAGVERGRTLSHA
jgi:hypothetical protein